METKKGVKFGAFTSKKLVFFPNNDTCAEKDEHAFLFNATDYLYFDNKDD